jgi:1-aminocyclopropane-1-carboxylate deaminase/D-cysteine desulfhydrase-like pyridoxal-dependent ACC family enzyme
MSLNARSVVAASGSTDTGSGIVSGMAFTLRTESVAGLDEWLEAEAAEQHTSKQAITIAALQEYRERRDLAHVLALGTRTAARHRAVLDRLADA